MAAPRHRGQRAFTILVNKDVVPAALISSLSSSYYAFKICTRRQTPRCLLVMLALGKLSIKRYLQRTNSLILQ